MLEPVSVTPGALLSNVGSFSSNISDCSKTSLRVTWSDSKNITADGTAFTIRFKALNTAAGQDGNVTLPIPPMISATRTKSWLASEPRQPR